MCACVRVCEKTCVRNVARYIAAMAVLGDDVCGKWGFRSGACLCLVMVCAGVRGRFSIWRLNCALAALHAHVTADAGYEVSGEQ